MKGHSEIFEDSDWHPLYTGLYALHSMHHTLHHTLHTTHCAVPKKGYAEIFKDGDWHPLCGHYFWNDNHGVTTICRSLGYELYKVLYEMTPHEIDAVQSSTVRNTTRNTARLFATLMRCTRYEGGREAGRGKIFKRHAFQVQCSA